MTKEKHPATKILKLESTNTHKELNWGMKQRRTKQKGRKTEKDCGD